MDLFNREIISYSISLSPNLWQIREMLSGLFAKLPADAKPYFIQTKVGNTSMQNINDYSKSIILYKVCPEKVIAWTMELWKTFLAD